MPSDSVLLYYLVAFIVLALIVGALLVWVVVSAVRNRRQKSGVALVMPGHAEKQLPSATPPPSAPTEDNELMRVMRDVRTGQVFLQIQGESYRALTDIRSPETGRLVLQTVSELGRFTRNVTPAVAIPASASPAPLAQRLGSFTPPASSALQATNDTPPAPGSLARRGEALIRPGALPPKTQVETETELSSASPAVSDPGRQTGPLKQTGPLRQTGPLKQTGPLSQPRVDMKSFWERALSRPPAGPGAAGPRPLADELEDVLVELIRSSPTAPPVTVHFRTADDGHLVIQVNGADYSNPDDVPDPVGKQIVQTVVRKWESG